jgi:hypothetical protein
MKARWIRLGAIGQRDFDAAYAALAAAQPRAAAPALLWGEEAARYPFALIAPLKFAPASRAAGCRGASPPRSPPTASSASRRT